MTAAERRWWEEPASPGRTSDAPSSAESPRFSEADWDLDGHDELACADYVADMYDEWRKREATWTYPNYLSGPQSMQTDLNAKMRAILVDWLVDVHRKFRLAEGTLYLAVQIVDGYLAKRPTLRRSLQLVGITALLLASKYEDVEAPEIGDCTYVCDQTYHASQVLAMELDILRALEWRIPRPNAHAWLARCMAIAQADAPTRHAAEYYAQRLLLELDVFDFKPSLVAAAASWLALGSPEPWPSDLAALTGYEATDLAVCGDVLRYYVHQDAVLLAQDAASGDLDPPPLLAVATKFCLRRYSAVAALPPAPPVTPLLPTSPLSARPNKRPKLIRVYTPPADEDDDERNCAAAVVECA